MFTVAAGSVNYNVAVRRTVKTKIVGEKMEAESSWNNTLKQALKGWRFLGEEEECFLY